MRKQRSKPEKNFYLKRFKKLYLQYANVGMVKDLLLTSNHLNFVSVILLLIESIIGIMIINKVKYTEIDWNAYMQEVEGFLNGTLDYSLLKGDTGPLVYPAGFVYIFSVLYFLTDHGKNILLAQYLFLCVYLVFLFLVFRIYKKSKKVPAYCLILMCFTTYRIHSLFLLRLFNDNIAVLLFFCSLNLMLSNYWTLGSICYSLAVSVKMNILLYAPALLLAYLFILGPKGTIIQLSICGLLQAILGLPFLIINPLSYLKGSFDFGRVFLYQWTVNWRFVPEEIFLDWRFHIFLLILHIIGIGLFYSVFVTYFKSYASLRYVQKEVKKQLKKTSFNMDSLAQLFLFPFFVVNLIGIVFSRSLHYQFYVWYYHSLPYLLWCTKFEIVSRLTLLGIIELCWNAYPSTIWSSGALLCCHLVLLYGLLKSGRSNIK